MPGRFKALFVSLDAVAIHAKLPGMAGGTLTLLPYRVHWMYEPVVQLVLSLNNLGSSTTVLGTTRCHPVGRVLHFNGSRPGVAILAPGVLMALGAGHAC
jgi:hypothetical protein